MPENGVEDTVCDGIRRLQFLWLVSTSKHCPATPKVREIPSLVESSVPKCALYVAPVNLLSRFTPFMSSFQVWLYQINPPRPAS